MANGYARLPGEVNAFQKNRNRSQTTVGPPPAASPQKKRASSFYPTRGQDTLDESNHDPFYLEHSLTNTASWGSCRRDFRDARSGEEIQQYFMLSLINSGAELPVPSVVGRGSKPRSHSNTNRSTLSVVELEHQLGLQRISNPPWGGEPLHQSHGSFSSEHTDGTPDLTPSSSFSSNYSAPIYPDTVIKATEQLSLLSKQANPTWAHKAYPAPSSPLNLSQSTIPTRPSTPISDPKPQRVPSNESSETLMMPLRNSHDSPSYRAKPLPSLPGVAREGNTRSAKKGPPGRLVIEPSMISPPSLINPVTLEPHRSHFDQALFIPANDCPSPVPSPGPPSPMIERLPTSTSTTRDRPSTSASEMYCEQSVWESDSETESTDPRSLSRKPIDTLKKVRSRVQLRVAKSAPKLQHNSTHSHHNTALEKFPSMPDPHTHEPCSMPTKTTFQTRSGKDLFRPSAQQTLRLVAPSTTSLVRPRSRRDSNKSRSYDIDRSTAAAMQAKSRRRQRSDCPEISLAVEREKMCNFCREDRSDKTLHHGLTLSRPPLYKRVWESLRVLGCHGDITPPRPRKAM